MGTETVFDNARVVLADRVIEGHVVVRDGTIAQIGEGRARRGEDCDGVIVMPGMVELHTDHIESHLLPRPKVRWNTMSALQAHDAQIATSGITTVFDALRVGMDEDGPLNHQAMGETADAILRAVEGDRLRADHYIHLRCEVSGEDVVEGFEALAGHERLRIASLMDHAPGQRQFADLEAYRVYYQGKLRLSDAEFELFREKRLAQSQTLAPANRRHLAGRCHEMGITLASHDDATEGHIAEAVQLGTAIAEFPTTVDAARSACEAGMTTVMGAPNVVRGGSHSGNVSAVELHRAGLLRALSSDYVPFSLLEATFQLAGDGEGGLPAAIALVTRHPAEAAGLSDRGAIAEGLRADLVRVRVEPGEPPVVTGVWRGGQRVA